MPRGVYKRKKRNSVPEPSPKTVTLSNLLYLMEAENIRHEEANDELVKQVKDLIGLS